MNEWFWNKVFVVCGLAVLWLLVLTGAYRSRKTKGAYLFAPFGFILCVLCLSVKAFLFFRQPLSELLRTNPNFFVSPPILALTAGEIVFPLLGTILLVVAKTREKKQYGKLQN